MPDTSATATRADVLLAEYGELKREQAARIDRRDHLVYATLTAVAGVIAAVVTRAGPAALLLLPPVCLVLGWTYLRNDEKVTAIGAYLRREIGPALADLTRAPALAWETTRLDERGRRLRKGVQLACDLATFPGPAAGAVLAWALTAPVTPATPVLAVVAGVELVAAAGFVALVVRGHRGDRGGQPTR